MTKKKNRKAYYKKWREEHINYYKYYMKAYRKLQKELEEC